MWTECHEAIRCDGCGRSPRLRNYDGLTVKLIDRMVLWEYRLKGWPMMMCTYNHLLVSEKMRRRFEALSVTGVEFVALTTTLNAANKPCKFPPYYVVRASQMVSVLPPEGMEICDACGYVVNKPEANQYGDRKYLVDQESWQGADFVECANVPARQRFIREDLGRQLLQGVKRTYLGADRLSVEQ